MITRVSSHQMSIMSPITQNERLAHFPSRQAVTTESTTKNGPEPMFYDSTKTSQSPPAIWLWDPNMDSSAGLFIGQKARFAIQQRIVLSQGLNSGPSGNVATAP